jgi:hypothetical protein
MTIPHLSDDELDAAVLGEELPAEVGEHLAGCVDCRRRRDTFLAVVEQARGADPDEAARVRVRDAALTAWGKPVQRHWARWVAAAAVIALSVLPLVLHKRAVPTVQNAEAVLVEVNQVLDRDPLSAMASEEVVNTVVPVSYESGERSAS